MQIIDAMLNNKTPGQLIIQITDRCNATCPQCSMRVNNTFARSVITSKHCEEIIDRATERGVQALSITGGEPLLYRNKVASLFRYASRKGIKYTRTGTNGFVFRNPETTGFEDRITRLAELLAVSGLRNFWISIDSADPSTHEQMRGFPRIISGIEKAIPIFHSFGLYPTANLGLNRNLGGRDNSLFGQGIQPVTQMERDGFKEAVNLGLTSFFKLVGNLGFTIVNFCYPMSIDKGENGLEAVYPANSTESLVRFTEAEKALLFSTMLETIPLFRNQIRIFSPLSSLHTLKEIYSGNQLKPFPCRGGLDYLFINAADRNVYPCGFRGNDNLGDYRRQLKPLTDRQDCSRCDWECFRDPSEFLGPLVHGLQNPLSLIGKYHRSREFYKLWLDDLRYYRACHLFDGRRDLDTTRLNKYKNHSFSLKRIGTPLVENKPPLTRKYPFKRSDKVLKKPGAPRHAG